MQLSKYKKIFLIFIGILGGVSALIVPLDISGAYKVLMVFLVAAIILLIMFKDELIPKIDKYKLREKSVESFFNEIDLQDVTCIDILTHTGRSTCAMLSDLLTTGDDNTIAQYRNIKIRVLVHDISYETNSRIRQISNTVQTILELNRIGYNIHVQYYHGLPTFRSIIVTTEQNGREDKKAFISWYRFVRERLIGVGIANSKKLGRAFIFSASQSKNITKKTMISLVESWFNRYWGKSEEGDIHTIIFDFDDTLVLTHDCQIQAWATAVRHVRNLAGEDADAKINEDIFRVIDDDQHLMFEIGKIFFQEESAQRIIDRLFVDLTEAEKREINDYRFEVRINLMNNCQFSQGALDAIERLAQKYHLGIVSATSSDLISAWLTARNMHQYLSVVFGKHEEVAAWKDISRKSLLIYQICNILGVPPGRMLYVGDRDGDYIAASAIGVDFVEARLFSAELMSYIGRGSLLPREHQGIYFDDWNRFNRSINQIINRKQRRMQAFAVGARIVEPMILEP